MAVAIVLASLFLWFGRHERAELERSIRELISSSDQKAGSGQFGQALVDLDAARALCLKHERPDTRRLDELNKRREALARSDAGSVLDHLAKLDSGSFPIGEWLNLRARIEADRDLAPLHELTERLFRSKLKEKVEREFRAASDSLAKLLPIESLDHCDAAAELITRLPPAERQELSFEAEKIVDSLLQAHGLVMDPLRGHLVLGSRSHYEATLVPELLKALRERGYLPTRLTSPWRSRWAEAPYRLTLDINEQLEGKYLSSENRLTRIEAKLTLYRRGVEIWKTAPTARTMVPVPSLPAYLSSRLALSPARIDDFERLLHDNAMNMIGSKFGFALNHMPLCSPANP